MTENDLIRRSLIAAIGYKTPADGLADRGGNYTIWVQIDPPDGLYYSPKDLTAGVMDRHHTTHQHLVLLETHHPHMRVFDTKSGKFRGDRDH